MTIESIAEFDADEDGCWNCCFGFAGWKSKDMEARS